MAGLNLVNEKTATRWVGGTRVMRLQEVTFGLRPMGSIVSGAGRGRPCGDPCILIGPRFPPARMAGGRAMADRFAGNVLPRRRSLTERIEPS